MKKIAAVIIVAMFFGASAISLCGAEELDGEIKVTVKDYVGIVYPEICLENTSVTFKVNITTDGNETSYVVEDVLSIPLNVTKETERETFIFPRSIFYSVIMRRPALDLKLLPITGLIKRIFPVFVPFATANVIDGAIGAKDEYLNITINYPISNETYLNGGENLTMHFIVMGFLPGEVNGIANKIPIIGHKTVTLEVAYEELV
jgi:hypothetical protein